MPEGDARPKWTKLKPGTRLPVPIGPPITKLEYGLWLKGRLDLFPGPQTEHRTQSSGEQSPAKPYRGKTRGGLTK